MAEAVLDIETSKRNTIKIDGAPYEIRSRNDLTISNYQKIERLSFRIGEMLEATSDGKELSPEREIELDKVLEEAMKIALVAGDEVIARIAQVDRLLIFEAFLTPLAPLLLRFRARQTQELKAAENSPGTRRPAVAPGSSVARRLSGKRKLR